MKFRGGSRFTYIMMSKSHIEWASALVPPTPLFGGLVERGREREIDRSIDR